MVCCHRPTDLRFRPPLMPRFSVWCSTIMNDETAASPAARLSYRHRRWRAWCMRKGVLVLFFFLFDRRRREVFNRCRGACRGGCHMCLLRISGTRPTDVAVGCHMCLSGTRISGTRQRTSQSVAIFPLVWCSTIMNDETACVYTSSSIDCSTVAFRCSAIVLQPPKKTDGAATAKLILTKMPVSEIRYLF